MSLVGRKFGKYELVENLGQGGMAEVYKAHQPGLDRYVAIKVMHRHLAQSPNFVYRFKREAKSIGQLQHPHILHVIDFDVEDDIYYLVMDYTPGDTLEAYLQQKGALSVAETLDLMGQLIDAVDYAHQRRMVHRDIKPANVMFLDEGCTHTLLNDFGMARLQDDVRLTATGTVVGTPAYMSPEAAMTQDVDERGDVYSLGIIMYEMLTGTIPFDADTAFAMMIKITSEPLPPPRKFRPDLPESVENLLFKALAKDKTQRIQSAAEFKTMLTQIQSNDRTAPELSVSFGDRPTIQATSETRQQLQQTEVIGSEEVGVPKEATPSTENFPWLALAGVAGFLFVIILVGVFFLFGQGDGGDGSLGITNVVPGAEALGTLRFRDGTAATSDYFLQLNQVAAPPADSHYTLWLQDATGGNTLNLVGQLPFDNGRILFEGSTEQNLLNSFSQIFLTIEPDGQSVTEMSKAIAYSGALSTEYTEAMRQILFGTPAQRTGFLVGTMNEISIAIQHVENMQNSIAADDFAGMKQHAEHVVNILDGESGPNFGDYTGDGQALNPGDGFGVRVYIEGVGQQTSRMATELPNGIDRQVELDRLQNTINNNTILINDAIKKTLRILATDTTTEAQPLVDDLHAVLTQAVEGTDLDGNGVIDPTKDEGGISAMYDIILPFAEIAIFPAE